MRILIVDDSRITRTIVKNTLRALGYPEEAFAEAANGDQAWSILEAEDIHLLLLDWNMPGINGLDLVKKLRASTRYCILPIVMVTSEAAKYSMVEAVKAGVTEYVVKPINEKVLEEKIRRALGEVAL